MIQTASVSDAWLGRTAAIEYDNAIQYAGVLDLGEEKKDILPGMVVKNVGNKHMALYDGTGAPFGLASVAFAPTYGKTGLVQVGEDGQFTAIVGGNNTTVRIFKDALDPKASFAVSTNGAAVPVYANAEGRLTSVKGSNPVVGALLETDADGSIVIQLHEPALA